MSNSVISAHLTAYANNHIAAATSTVYSIVTGNPLIQSILVGLVVFYVTAGVRALTGWIFNKLKKEK